MAQPLFIAIHTHEYGTSVRVFPCDQDAAEIFNTMPDPEFDTDWDDDDEALTRVDFAKRLNLNYEPEKGERLEVQRIHSADFTPVDFSDFTG
jgi:hypothetical protein